MNYEKAGVKFDAIEKEIGLKFKDHALLGQAFVHDSYLNEHQKEDLRSNERLEFLGDAVINLAAAHYLYKTSDAPEGTLTEARKSLVSDPALAKTARSLHLGDYIILSNGEQASGGRDKESILAGCFEALVGAVFIQFDYDEAQTDSCSSLYSLAQTSKGASVRLPMRLRYSAKSPACTDVRR